MKKHRSILMGSAILGLYFFYSCIGALGKYNAVSSAVWSFRFLFFLGLQLMGLMLFTIGWQFLLKKFDLSYVYLFKGTTVLWGLVLARLFFNEEITICNLLGAIVIMIGIGVVFSE